MIWHFFEVWLLLAGVFVVGCGLGASVYTGLARGRLAAAQGVVADAVGDIIDEIKWRLGVAPDWRPGYEPPERLSARSMREDVFLDGPPRHAQLPPRSSPDAPSEGKEDWPDAAYRREQVADREESDVAGSAAANNSTGDDVDQPAKEEGRLADDDSMMRPAGLTAPRAGVADNLQRIRGIGKRNEALLHNFGIFHFGQIAAWTPAEARWVASHLAFPESLEGDDWIGQAIVLASGGDTGYLPRADRRKLAREREGESES